MQTSQTPPGSAAFHLYHKPMQDIDPYYLAHYQILQSNSFHDILDNSSQGTTVSFETYNQEYCTLESTPIVAGLIVCDSPSFASVSSNRSPFSSQVSQTRSWHSDQLQSSDNTYESPTSGCSSADDEKEYAENLKEIENTMMAVLNESEHYQASADDVNEMTKKLKEIENTMMLNDSEHYQDYNYTYNRGCSSADDGNEVTKKLKEIENTMMLNESEHSQNYDCTYNRGCSSANDGNQVTKKLQEMEIQLMGEPEIYQGYYCTYKRGLDGNSDYNFDLLVEKIPQLNLTDVLKSCAYAMAEMDYPTATGLMDKMLEGMVSVKGEPVQRLGAYLLEGLRAKMEASGSAIYKSIQCEQEQPPTSQELLNYMGFLYRNCPYWKFAYTTANAVITEALQNESRIHIIDFQIAQGTQWKLLLEALAKRPGGPPFVRVTGVDDSQSFHARAGGLDIVGQYLSTHANSLGVPFEFHIAATSGCEVQRDNLGVQPGEALAVNFPYVLHHMPDESVSTENHRDRLLRLVKSLSPMLVTLVEQESNTNTSPFYQRFVETLDYYTAMFESIDAAGSAREDPERIKAEQHCVARDIVNMIGCDDKERVERHELFGKWKSRFEMAGFRQCPVSQSVGIAALKALERFNENYKLTNRGDGALYLCWKNRAMSTFSVWR